MEKAYDQYEIACRPGLRLLLQKLTPPESHASGVTRDPGKKETRNPDLDVEPT